MIKQTKAETCKFSTKCKNINITKAFKINERQFSDHAPSNLATSSLFSSLFLFKAFGLPTKEISFFFSSCPKHKTNSFFSITAALVRRVI